MDDYNKDSFLSDDVINGFKPLEYTLQTMVYPKIYNKIYAVLPKETVSFNSFGRETLIACEVVCAAICHKINWDFLRNAIYKKTLNNEEWLKPFNLEKITIDDIYGFLSTYEKKDRIMAKDRCSILCNVGKTVNNLTNSFEGIFFDTLTMQLKEFKEVKSFFEKCQVFSSDPQQKKMQLLFQSLSDYGDFEYLNKVYKATIDYHLIRLYLRRGIVKPVNKFALEYIFNNKAARKENTVASLRKVCADSLDMLSWITSLDLKSINRVEWWVARTVCINGAPDCYLESKEAEWLKGTFNKCPYYYCCYAIQCDEKFLEISEPLYNGISY